MNVILPEKEKMSKKTITIYIISLIICILAICIVIAIQVLGDNMVNNIFGINKLAKRTEQEENELKASFETIFDNQIEEKGNYSKRKIDKNEKIVYTSYNKQEKTDRRFKNERKKL